MCAPVSDGAAAVLICSEDVLQELPNPRPVKILASQIKTGVDRTPMEFEKNISHLVAQAAYNEAGVGPRDISCAEIHDATAFAEIQQVENLMFTSFGSGGELIESGACGIGGRIRQHLRPSSGAIVGRLQDSTGARACPPTAWRNASKWRARRLALLRTTAGYMG